MLDMGGKVGEGPGRSENKAGKDEFTVFTGQRRGHHTSYRATWRSTRMVRRQKGQEGRESEGWTSCWGFRAKGKAWQSLNNFGGP